MSRHKTHAPGLPRTPEPPPDLVALAQTLTHPSVNQVGVTTTGDGEWALLVRVHRGTRTPLAEVQAQSKGFPVVYQDEPKHLPVARPAYPGFGE